MPVAKCTSTFKRPETVEEDAAIVMAELCEALSYLHGLAIAHNDVKPENICFITKPGTDPDADRDMSIRLIDFGYAAVVRPEVPLSTTWRGSPKYG